jgi:formiminotetrahydrofolate cyclodeaminase
MLYFEKSINDYLKELSSNSPIPGGGSAAALVGALGAALLSKVANFTIGKDKFKDVEIEIKKILASSEKLLSNLEKLIDRDALAYQKVVEAYRLAKNSEEEKRVRTSRIQKSLRQALEVPLIVCHTSLEAIRLCLPLAEKGNINLISDVGVAAELLSSAFQSALLNIEINLSRIKDGNFVTKVRKELASLNKEIDDIKEEVINIVKEKVNIS